jgi:protein TonB
MTPFDLDPSNPPLAQNERALSRIACARASLALPNAFLGDGSRPPETDEQLKIGKTRTRQTSATPVELHGPFSERPAPSTLATPLIELPRIPLTAAQRRSRRFRSATLALVALAWHLLCAALVVAFGGRFEPMPVPETPFMLVSFGALDGVGPAGAGLGELKDNETPTAPPLGEPPTPNDPVTEQTPAPEPAPEPAPDPTPEQEQLISPVKTADPLPETRKETPAKPVKPKKEQPVAKPKSEPKSQASAVATQTSSAGSEQAVGSPSGVPGGVGGGGVGKGDPDSPYVGDFGAGEGPAFLKQARPEYPAHAKRLGKEGVVVLRLIIDHLGRLINAEVVRSAGAVFDEAALLAVRASQYKPAVKDGRARPSRATLQIKFQLSSK